MWLNGQAVYTGDDFYYPAARRLNPEGRFAPDNARVVLPLRKGRNELVLATIDAWRRTDRSIVLLHYGWAAKARFEDMTGLSLP